MNSFACMVNCENFESLLILFLNFMLILCSPTKTRMLKLHFETITKFVFNVRATEIVEESEKTLLKAELDEDADKTEQSAFYNTFLEIFEKVLAEIEKQSGETTEKKSILCQRIRSFYIQKLFSLLCVPVRHFNQD
jgi:hypothetical protein